MVSPIFSWELVVPKNAIDALGHVNNLAYLQWVLEVAQKHWEAKAPKAVRAKVHWVVLNHFIAYKKPAFEGERLLLQTWVENFEGVKSERHTEIRRKSDDVLMVKAETLWCLVSAENLRPKRITSEISKVFSEG